MSSSDQEIFQSAPPRALLRRHRRRHGQDRSASPVPAPANPTPLDRAMVVFGRAMTVLEADVFIETVTGSPTPSPPSPSASCSKRSTTSRKTKSTSAPAHRRSYALWGELMSVRALNAARRRCRRWLLPRHPRRPRSRLSHLLPWQLCARPGPRGKVLDFRIPIQIGQVRICPATSSSAISTESVLFPVPPSKRSVPRLRESRQREDRPQSSRRRHAPKAAFEKYGIL